MRILRWKRCGLAIGFAVFMLTGALSVSPTIVQATQVTTQGDQTPAKKTELNASLTHDSVKVGNQVKVKCKIKGVTYKSSDTAIAYVDAKGVITGKKAGTVTITVRKKGKGSCKLSLTVRKHPHKPDITALYPETKVVGAGISDGMYQMKVKNLSKGKIRKIKYVYRADVVTGESQTVDPETGVTVVNPVIKTKTFQLTADHIRAGATSAAMTCQAPASGSVSDMKLISVTIYAGHSKITYKTASGKTTYGWGTKDKNAPVITGMVGSNSHKNGQVYINLYEDMKFDFAKYIKATDDRDGKVKIHVNTDKIDYSKPGVYTLKVTAKDKAGNVATEKVKVRVLKKSDADKMADTVLSKIVKPSWSDEKKVRAIYTYVTGHLSYVFNSKYHEWHQEAAYAFRYGYGDCFAYYSLTKALVNRCGIPNLMIQRNTVNPTHYWNMVYVNGGWYHVDTCARQIRKYLCLVTDEQMIAFSNYYNAIAGFQSNSWEHAKYPMSSNKVITSNYK